MNLISKKDLLAITGISYGQLYRWKRERLIPEEWFIKQSAYTGQETFFPREQILSRIKSILDLKDDYSLEELAKMLSPDASSTMINYLELNQIDEIDKELIQRLPVIYSKQQYDFMEAALMIAVSKSAKDLGISADEAEDLFVRSIAAAMAYKNVNVTCTIFRTESELHALFTQSSVRSEFDSGIQVVDQIHLSEIVDQIKTKYKTLFTK